MPSTRLPAESTPVETPLQQRSVSAHSDVHAVREPELGTKHGSNGWRTLVNYISGGQGGRGGNGLQGHGGAGGAGEGPTLHYDLKAENIVVKTFNGLDATPPDFLRIPLGNINLQSEIRADTATGVVWQHCHNEPMTVAMYQGDNAEEEWKRDISHHSGLRHPHVLQIYASASSSGINAVVFHDDLVLFSHFLDSFCYSVILRVYILAYTNADYRSAQRYSKDILSIEPLPCTLWIRCSTGRLCIEFSAFETHGLLSGPEARSPPRSVLSPHDPNQESLVIASLGYPEWYSICESYLCQRPFDYVSRFEHAIELASATGVQNEWSGWYGVGAEQWGEEDGAVRYNSRAVFGRRLHLHNRISAAPWLAQANYILNQLKVVLNHEDHKLVDLVIFTLKIGKTTLDPPDGYLFICSPEDFETGPMSIRWPDRPAYWSLDPSSSNPLSDGEASSLGFPTITQRTMVVGTFWDETVYAGLRKFDECKGFNPDSQDLAKELGHPLYEVCVPTSAATKWKWPVDRDDESNFPNVYFEEEYTMDDEMESNSHLASSCVEMLTTDDGNFLEELSSDGSDCSNSYPEDGVPEVELNPSSCNQELIAENDLPSHDMIVVQYYSIGELAELVKFGLIVVLGLTTLYEYGRVLF
ncbi:hypothetical protein MSAN_01103600 [Mycena sanguinolenta]|uniref:Uncharacterized protein n=1 Tax=Mycena sanguinolenta TaxID=230812 RepID=A0A8H6YTB1_9AGAR|nr:hypothetical protein MSAN_01103600 [Mycena sanguinolenta]